MIYTILALSLLLNVFSFWYIRELLKRFSFFSDNITNFHSTVVNYENHLKNIYELEVFYGDETLGGLLTHTKELKNDIGSYREVFSLEDFQDSNLLIEEEDNEEI
jgi:hypothetical protein|tara:strand:+ start:1166 stop:1480 length:315 start_codon:yes stop_codon:yes gene_type:complete